ncbi:LysR substrate-binding domain-containing protein [Bordetella bronchialis]|uniref:LysR family transcriptional regulator n=1 Tax=Bordetella bronchialis TaxID=463025 RepID=A0A193FIG0_9BORD|nr:LysR substrate-binding domain-containing protein [Bordetella bronchialis]ANN66894.1 LysR family transcriptional regulator [Bordetella bronchialis]ANN71970.1 LysR family transcriptional regulator [Bordetella bronchialis]
MDFRQLRYFVAVAEELSFSAAARRLHVSQPPLSMQVKSLEDELGATLLRRTKRHVELTEAGTLFLDQARRALQHLERAGDVVRQAMQGEAGEIRVAFTASVPMFEAFPRIVQAFRSRHPAARADLLHMSTGQQLQALADRSIDVGFLRPSILFCPPPDIRVVTLWSDRLMAALPASHPLAREDAPLPVAALAGSSFILFPRGLGCGLFEHVGVLASRAGFALQVGQEAREGATIVGLVAAGMGVSILPETYARTGIPGVVYRPLDTPDAASQILLAHRYDNDTPLLARFFETAAAS